MIKFRNLGRVGLALLALNEIRGLLVVASVLMASLSHPEAGQPNRLEKLEVRLVCALVAAPCGGDYANERL